MATWQERYAHLLAPLDDAQRGRVLDSIQSGYLEGFEPNEADVELVVRLELGELSSIEAMANIASRRGEGVGATRVAGLGVSDGGAEESDFRRVSGRWTLGECAHCGGALDPDKPSLFCSERCRVTAKDIRYFRGCYRDGRIANPDVRAALRMRMAHHVGGGYDAKARHLDAETRHAVLADNGGLCCACNTAPATQVDHIDGPSSGRANLQGLCVSCHDIKTNERMVPMTDEDKVVRDIFLAWVERPEPAMAAHDELTWDGQWPARLAETRSWAAFARGEIEAGYFGDGSTGTVEDREHGEYLQMLAERDD